MKALTGKIWKAERRAALLQLMLDLATFAGMAASAYMLFTATMSGEITVGMFAAVFAALTQIFAIMQEVVKQHMGNMNRDVGKVMNFIRLLDMPERTGEQGETDLAKGISAEKISRVLKEAGFEKDGIGLEDMLSPDFGGADLFGGQWQRIAMQERGGAGGSYKMNMAKFYKKQGKAAIMRQKHPVHFTTIWFALRKELKDLPI